MSSILKALKRAYDVKKERNWDTVYYAVDLHGVCLKSNYENNSYEWINEEAKTTLQLISNMEGNKIILWSSVHKFEMVNILRFFKEANIDIHGFNTNISEPSNDVSYFGDKFYFSVLFDDKAGFDPETDWTVVNEFITNLNTINKLESAYGK